MFQHIGKLLHPNYLIQISCIKSMTTTEVSTALRPFYFSVHPDLFGQHPVQRLTNENSLKQLSSFLETLQKNGLFKPCELQFYMRTKERKDNFELVSISLKEKDVRQSVLTILKSCKLSTEFVDKIPQPQKSTPFTSNLDFSKVPDDDIIFGPIILTRKIREFNDQLFLKQWLDENYKNAFLKSESNKPVREEIKILKSKWKRKLGLADIRWDSDWNEMQFRGCLRSFDVLAQQHPVHVTKLQGRILVFSSFTGVSLDGHVMLFNGEVRHNWLDLIKNIRKYDSVLLRIPDFEKAVSQVLRNIKVVRRKFMPKIMAREYERHLTQITTAISDYLSRRNYPKIWPDSLELYQIVVESGEVAPRICIYSIINKTILRDAGPLMVSPTGQFIVPASCPGFLLVNFISDNLRVAEERMSLYQKNKHVEKSIEKECLTQLGLADLHKDDNINPDLMIKCCERLLLNKQDLKNLKNLHLNIATYYSVLDDGVVCIPWNWQL